MGDLRPFHLTGPFISMIGYVLTDIRPFMVLGTLMIIAFGTAFRVLFEDPTDNNGEDHTEEKDGVQSFSTSLALI